MNVLFLMISFPEITKNPNLYTELAEDFSLNGHNVFVATISEKKYNQSTTLSEEMGIKVLRIKCGDLFNVGFIRKGITTISIPYLFLRAIRKYFRGIKFDLVLYPTPPITFVSLVKLFKKKFKAKSYLILRDIFPQNAVDLGLMNPGIIFNYFRRKEQALYNVSDFIGCMSNGNIKYVIEHNKVQNEKLELLPNWKRINKKGISIDFREKLGLHEKIIAVFGGNIGIAQELEFLLELAKCYRERPDLVFLIAGEGNQKDKILSIIQENKLSNVICFERINSIDFEDLIRQCDIGLINLNRKFTIPNIPSKTVSYFNAAIPILAAIDANTDYGTILEEAKAGFWSITGNLSDYRNNFEKLLNNEQLRKEMGQNGKKYLETYLTVEKAYQTIMKHFK